MHRRVSTFIFGMVAGALLLYLALNYHLINARDGLHLVPKVESTLAGTYADIRSFGPRDWAEHADIAAALLKAERTDLLESAARDSAKVGLDRLLGPQN